jgi:hypothetical protein
VAVAPYFCDADSRLDIEVRACNEKPCPPRYIILFWHVQYLKVVFSDLDANPESRSGSESKEQKR